MRRHPAGLMMLLHPHRSAGKGKKDPVLLTSLSAKIDRCMGRINSLETELGTSKKIMGGAILTLVSRVKNRSETVNSLGQHVGGITVWHLSLGHDQAAVPSEDMEERKEEEKMLTHRQRFEEDQASQRLVQKLQAEDLAQEYMPNVSEERAKELDELMMRMTETDWLNLMMQVGSNPALARELLGADVTEENFVERMTAIKDKKKRALADLPHNGTISMTAVKAMSKTIQTVDCRPLLKDNGFAPASSQPSNVPAATTQPSDDHDSAGGSSFHPASSAPPLSGSAAPTSAGGVSECFMNSLSLLQQQWILCSHRDEWIKVETVSDYARLSPPQAPSSESESDDDLEHYIPPLPSRQKSFFYLKQLLPHVYREDLLLLRRRMNRYFRLNPDVDVGLDLWRDVNLLCQSLHSDDVEDFWRTQDDWIMSSWKLYPKSSVHVLDLTNGKTVYMFVDRVYPIRATLLERMLRHKLTVPPSYCRDVVVAGSVIQTVQAGLRESYECLASAPKS
ncbi:hypothetical protein Tco_0548849 [Tanacetum coccineum]